MFTLKCGVDEYPEPGDYEAASARAYAMVEDHQHPVYVHDGKDRRVLSVVWGKGLDGNLMAKGIRTYVQEEIYCNRCGEEVPEEFDHSGRKVPQLTCGACLPMIPDPGPKKRAPRPGIGSLLDDAPAIFIGR